MKTINTFSFDYNGHNSAEFDLMIGGISISDDIPLGLSREILAGSINRYRSTLHHMGTQWSDVLQFELSFVKNPCEYPNQADMIFTEYEINKIAAWLTSPDYPILFKMYDDDLESFTRFNYFGLFSDLQPQILDGDIVGLTCTFRTSSPFAWTDVITKSYEITESANLNVPTQTAEYNREIYPLITVTPSNVGNPGRVDITITNHTDNDRSITMSLLKEITTYIDCQNSRIYDANGLISMEDVGIGDLTYIYWPRLYYGNNQIEITGDATVTFSWREPRKVGAY